MRSPTHYTRGALWAVVSASAYSLSSVIGKDLLDHLHPTALLFWRFSLATAVLWTVLLVWRRRGGPDPFDVPKAKSFLVGALFGVMVFLGFVAMQSLDASVYIVLIYTYPALVVIGTFLLGERPSGWTWIALMLVMAGVVMTADLVGGGRHVSTKGVVIALVQSVLMTVYVLLSSRVLPARVNGIVNAAWITLGATSTVTMLGLFNGFAAPDSVGTFGELVALALAATVLSTVTFFLALRDLPAGVAAMVLTLEVVLVMVLSALFLGERMTGLQTAGAATVLAGVLLAQWAGYRRARAVAVAL